MTSGRPREPGERDGVAPAAIVLHVLLAFVLSLFMLGRNDDATRLSGRTASCTTAIVAPTFGYDLPAVSCIGAEWPDVSQPAAEQFNVARPIRPTPGQTGIYIVEGANAKVRGKLGNSLPEGARGGVGAPRKIDFLAGPLDTTAPYIRFKPC